MKPLADHLSLVPGRAAGPARPRRRGQKPKGEPELTLVQRRLVDVAAAIREADPNELLFYHSVTCQCALPARRPPEDVRTWERQQGRAALLIEAGKVRHPTTGAWQQLGLPFGPKARMLLMHLNTEALRHRSPDIEVGRSLTGFVARVQGRGPTGPEITAFKEQLAALAAATVRLALGYDAGCVRQIDTRFVSGMDLWLEKDDRQRVLWPTTLYLSLDYYDSLTRHAVPLDERAIAALAHSATALDVYAWLAQRLHRVPPGKPQLVPWPALWDQFGQHYAELRFFRREFLAQLRQVHLAYPQGRIEPEENGLRLFHSPPPVAKRLVTVPRTPPG